MNTREIEDGLLEYEEEREEHKRTKAENDAYNAIILRDIERIRQEMARKELEKQEKAIAEKLRKEEAGPSVEAYDPWYDDDEFDRESLNYRYDDFDDWDDDYDDDYY